MGKYSLENYELYKAHKARPKPRKDVIHNLGKGKFTGVELSWKELEINRGEYRLERLEEALKQSKNPLIILNPDPPEWVVDKEAVLFGKLIRRVGSFIDHNSPVTGVLVTTIHETHLEWDAYPASFQVPIIVPLDNPELIRYYQRKGISFGLFIEGNDNNWIDLCETMGRLHLSNTWEKEPIIIHIGGEEKSTEFLEQAKRWHASFTNACDEYGYQIELRRLLYPKEVSSDGYLPLRFWFVNVGTGLCYLPYRLTIKLWNDQSSYRFPLNVTANQWGIGDITYHEILKLPKLEEGVYRVAVGLFMNSMQMNLAIDSSCNQGFYEIGNIKIDNQERDELADIWSNYYPEGYYPLEDPKEPNT